MQAVRSRTTARVLLVVLVVTLMVFQTSRAAEAQAEPMAEFVELLKKYKVLEKLTLKDLLKQIPNSVVTRGVVFESVAGAGSGSVMAKSAVHTTGVVVTSSGGYSAATGYAATGVTAVGGASAGSVVAVVVGGLAVGYGIVQAGKWMWCETNEPGARYIFDRCDVPAFDPDYDQAPGWSPTGVTFLGNSAAYFNQTWQADPETYVDAGGWARVRGRYGYTWNGPYSNLSNAVQTYTYCRRGDGSNLSSGGGWTSLNNTETRESSVVCPDVPDLAYFFADVFPKNYPADTVRFRWDWKGEWTVHDRRAVATVECENYAGERVSATSSSPIYVHGTDEITDPGDIPSVECPPGYRVVEYEATREADGLVTETVAHWQAPSVVTDPTTPERDAIYDPDAYIMLERLMPDGTTWRECSDDGVTCTAWATDPARDSKYRCVWGGYVVELEDCKALVEAFDTPGDGFTVSPDAPALPDVDPDPDPTPSPSESPAPGLPGPDPDGEGDPTPDKTPGLDDGCIPHWWDALTPFGMTKAVGCALTWAFTPSEATLARADDAAQQLQTKVPFAYVTGSVEWLGAFSSIDETCWVEDFSMGSTGYEPIRVIDTCAGDGVWAWLRANRALMGAFLYLGLGIPLAWWGWRAYAPGTIQGG